MLTSPKLIAPDQMGRGISPVCRKSADPGSARCPDGSNPSTRGGDTPTPVRRQAGWAAATPSVPSKGSPTASRRSPMLVASLPGPSATDGRCSPDGSSPPSLVTVAAGAVRRRLRRPAAASPAPTPTGPTSWPSAEFPEAPWARGHRGVRATRPAWPPTGPPSTATSPRCARYRAWRRARVALRRPPTSGSPDGTVAYATVDFARDGPVDARGRRAGRARPAACCRYPGLQTSRSAGGGSPGRRRAVVGAVRSRPPPR